VTFNELQTRQKFEQTFKGDDMLTPVDYANRNVQFLYQDGELWTFMDNEDYNQYSLSTEELGETAQWLTDGMEGLVGMMVDGNLVGIQLPVSVTKTVVETAPRLKGATATKSAKPAELEGGITVLVPEYIENGEVIKVNTQTKEFMSRA
jgi:elongation factor P